MEIPADLNLRKDVPLGDYHLKVGAADFFSEPESSEQLEALALGQARAAPALHRSWLQSADQRRGLLLRICSRWLQDSAGSQHRLIEAQAGERCQRWPGELQRPV